MHAFTATLRDANAEIYGLDTQIIGRSSLHLATASSDIQLINEAEYRIWGLLRSNELDRKGTSRNTRRVCWDRSVQVMLVIFKRRCHTHHDITWHR